MNLRRVQQALPIPILLQNAILYHRLNMKLNRTEKAISYQMLMVYKAKTKNEPLHGLIL